MIENQNNTISDDLVNKIKGLLRLATSSNQHEAELAMQRAKALCVKNEIEMSTLDAFSDSKPKHEPITKDSIQLGKRLPTVQHNVARILRDYFNVRILYSGGRWGGRSVTFIGRKTDIELAQYLNSHLTNEFVRLWHKYYTENEVKGVTLKDKPGFVLGLEQGLSQKLDESQKHTEQESFTACPVDKVEKIKACYAVACINLKKNIDDKVAEFYPHLRKATVSRNIHNYNSIGAGRALGKTISVNRPLGYSGQSRIS
jgi:Protein of unknown function (DUF2786)